MSYEIKLKECSFFMYKGYELSALVSIKKMCREKQSLCGIDAHYVLNTSTFKDALKACFIEAEYDDLGNVVGLNYMKSNLGDQFYIFESIAPYVDNGSYIEIEGEDNERWRCCFEGGNCIIKHPKITLE